jgi:polyisoprenoid-binding protein YceI
MTMKWILPALLALTASPTVSFAQQTPVFVVMPLSSTVKFHVAASMKLDGTFSKWTSTLVFTSPHVSSGVLDIKIDAASVSTGDGMKDSVLKGGDFFAVKTDPVISFHSTGVTRTGPDTFAVTGNFTIRGMSAPQTLILKTTGRGTASGTIDGTMVFNRKTYGMNKGVPFVRIGDNVDVAVHLKIKRVSGSALTD